mgnify:CR=1 FL=1
MKWCLDCHRDPADQLRPVSEVTNMRWTRPDDHEDFIKRTMEELKISPPTDCQGCHR